VSIRDIVRAWRDEEYRQGLSEAERALLPAHPSGLIDLPDAALDAAVGGAGHNSSQQQCTPVTVCHSQKPLSCPTKKACIVWG
jgi:mersacidin/lichenicidin family type 2 lantibiotic